MLTPVGIVDADDDTDDDDDEQALSAGLLGLSVAGGSGRPKRQASQTTPRTKTKRQRRETVIALRALADQLIKQQSAETNSRSSTQVLDDNADENLPDYSNLKIPSLESVRDLLGLSNSLQPAAAASSSNQQAQASTEASVLYRDEDLDGRLRVAIAALEDATATGVAHLIALATVELQRVIRLVMSENARGEQTATRGRALQSTARAIQLR